MTQALVALAAVFVSLHVSLGHAAPERPRVLVSSDIGGTDPDDFQSMVHLLVSSDRLDLEGIVSSPYGPGRVKHIHQVIDLYARDYPQLIRHSPQYPAPASLHARAKQGALDGAGPAGFDVPTEGSDWIIACARRPDPRPLWILVWGGIDDLAQALHDAPDIVSKLRVYFIGGPNKTWSVNAFAYIERQYPQLWIIEANSTYRGWFTGGDQSGDWGNATIVARHIAGHGALGNFFASHLKGTMKMGDSPSVTHVLGAAPENPAAEGRGGQFVPIWRQRNSRFDRLTTAADQVEAFAIVEISLAAPADLADLAGTRMYVDNRLPMPAERRGDRLVFRFSPRDAKVWPYVIQSNHPALHGQAGAFTAVQVSEAHARARDEGRPNWWSDDPAPATAEGAHAGAKTVSRWRRSFLQEFADLMTRCLPAADASNLTVPQLP
jgi:hypothetical protein